MTGVGKRRLVTLQGSATKGGANQARGPPVRIERLLASRGVGSRRECAKLISAGRVCVDGGKVRSPSQKVLESALVTVDGKEVQLTPLLLAFYKPYGVHSTMGDPMGRPSLVDVTPEEWRRQGLHPVGRLDRDTTGLLLFSSDGQLTHKLLHPKHSIEREYVAKVDGDASDPGLGERLAAGVETSDGCFPATLTAQTKNEVRLIVAEGKYRMVRRILANVGLPVLDLHRVRYGAVVLGDLDLDPGQVSSSATPA